MTGMNGNNNNPRPKAQGIHHANIKDKKKAVKRLKNAFRKTALKLTVEKDKRNLNCTAVLMEVQPKSAYVFVHEQLPKHTLVELHFKEPLQISIRGRVRYSEQADRNSQPKKSQKISYRMYIEFLISGQSEADAMQDFFQQVRDENYVATKWHHYVSEKAQVEAKLRASEMKISEKVKEVQGQPELATDQILNPVAGAATVESAEAKGDPGATPEATDSSAKDPKAA